jgi:class 3 adenylate cyclase
MKRRSKVSGRHIKGRREKTPDPTRRNAPKHTPAPHVPRGEYEHEFSRLTHELSEAREQQAATSEVLKAISGSAFDLRTVLDTLLQSAVRLCRADQGTVAQRRGDTFYRSASYGFSPAYLDYVKDIPVKPGRDTGTGRALLEGKVIHIPDVLTDPDFTWKEGQRLGGFRTVLGVPMLREGVAVGVMALTRSAVRPFTDEQIALVENFAAQAVIAIENARLLNELRRRTDDLSKLTTDLTQSLEQQTATAKVLDVISRAAFDLRAVFETVVESSVRLCGAERGAIYRFDGETLRITSSYNVPPQMVEWIEQHPFRPGTDSASGRASARAALERRTVHISDVDADPAYTSAAATRARRAWMGRGANASARTLLAVPILKGDALLGVIAIYRLEVRPFTDKQIALVETFADQAAIAIENVRLLDELRERTEEVGKLNRHLEQRVTDQVDEIERMSRLRRFLPPQVADLILASGTEKQLESHRREITALFCDLRGFTGFTESADAEDVMALLRDYHAAVGETIIKYNGTLERYAGDGVMVIFNDPVPVENPALQAVLMALELREALGALTATWSRLGHEIGFGIGIAHGFATLGTIGFEGRFDYAAIGTVSNVASRLCDEAKPGQILISPRVLMKVENAVKVEPVGEFELKGIRRPLAAYNVVSSEAP